MCARCFTSRIHGTCNTVPGKPSRAIRTNGPLVQVITISQRISSTPPYICKAEYCSWSDFPAGGFRVLQTPGRISICSPGTFSIVTYDLECPALKQVVRSPKFLGPLEGISRFYQRYGVSSGNVVRRNYSLSNHPRPLATCQTIKMRLCKRSTC